MKNITGQTKLLGVIGHPVEHSLSPAMHNAAIARLGLDYVYLPLPVHPEDLAEAVAGFAAIGLVGFNITIPHKQAILPFLSETSPVAQMVGAVNTVWRKDTGWYGTNTDVEGFIAPLKAIARDWSQITPVILGNGGAARAVIAGCAELGCSQIFVVGRNPEKLDRFKQSWQNTPLADRLRVFSWDELPGLVSQTGLLVNTTPVGMASQRDRAPIEANILRELPSGAIAYDLIYTPSPTLFLQQAQECGATIVDGSEMLVQQGAAALQMWLGQPVPVNEMRQALLAQLE
ncbi:shikimate dehydrogenase [Lusitaniella coriacea LEGE 07157]|uniref:Shikimate dehydrogenase (NADP(+)) n=1 Tax=Lusitaniella coriacea LEGE 07157 TaxID=945747 RepID=A0A8J7DU47_9CYAN|nr:shikimate dehydrogenase [Lusitaniella coriacea]MBE9115026.1 shikimate dehydrogenase [Lusitaniella coriacea LEGE 07157]